MNRHLDNTELQRHLEGERLEEPLRIHLEECGNCAARFGRFRTLSEMMDRMERLEPSPLFEEMVCARLYPRRAQVPAEVRRVPGPWARVFAPAFLLTGSALFYAFIRVIEATGDVALRGVLQADPGILRSLALKITVLLPLLHRFIAGVVDLAGLTAPLGRALQLAGGTPQVRFLLLASAGLFLIAALGWGTRFLVSRSKGGHHDLLLA